MFYIEYEIQRHYLSVDAINSFKIGLERSIGFCKVLATPQDSPIYMIKQLWHSNSSLTRFGRPTATYNPNLRKWERAIMSDLECPR